MVGPDGALPLPWLAPVMEQTLRSQHAHALLLHGPQGVGQFELALSLAQAWLCEAKALAPATASATARASASGPCGNCASCKLVNAHSHPDLLVLLPEALQVALGWNAAESEEGGPERASKAKPSQEIKVEAVRRAVAFAQITSARGRGKVVVLQPAERMNGISANTLLKTLEEPVGDTRFILSCAAPDALLPTIRSRCQAVPLSLPPVAEALAWLTAQGVEQAEVMLAATGGQPQEALAWSLQGIDAALWNRLPALVAQGISQPLGTWPLPRVVDALQKLCHDAASVACGAVPRYFAVAHMGQRAADPAALHAWMAELRRIARHAEHPWNAGLVVESLVQRGQRALAPREKTAAPGRSVSVHSRA